MNLKMLAAAAASVLMLSALTACAESVPAAESSKSAQNPAQTSQTSQSAAEQTGTTAADTPAAAPNFVFSVNGTEIRISDESDPIVAKLGTPLSTFDAPSCAFSGTSYTYNYPGYKLETYPDNGVNRVYSVTLTDDTVTTPEGLKVSDTAETVKAKLGAPAKDTNTFVQYTTEGAELTFFFEEKQIVYSYPLG